AFLKEGRGDLLASSVLCQFAGSLTKSSLLPLVLVLNVLLLVAACRRYRDLPALLKDYFRAPRPRRAVLLAGVLLGLGLNVQLYGGNYVRYGRLAPEMADVFPPAVAMQNRLGARGTVFALLKEGRISFPTAMELASSISHPGDRRDTMYLLHNYVERRSRGAPLQGPLAYVVPWTLRMAAGIFGIMGHLSLLNLGPTLAPFLGLMGLAALGFAVRWRPREDGWLPPGLAVIALFYAAFLMYAVNYRTYLYYESFILALQGRYIFPVLGPLYVLSSWYLLRLFEGRYVRLLVFVAASVVFLGADFPSFLVRATPEWFAPPMG
ncbi:MAG: hypothetical protein HY900_11935, partial [Deltaproteobacteria bacterium]|nr:hypothetical protein [Deltaproteobacteria bacterium]